MKSSEELLQNWKERRPNYKNFCNDGILVKKAWEKANPKIMFLVTETHIHLTNIQGQMGPGDHNCTFWRKLKIWTYVITEYLNGRIPALNAIYNIMEEPNDSIALIHLKKDTQKIDPCLELSSDYEDVLNYVKNDRDFLLKQIELINPDVIFCCETIRYAEELFPGLLNISNRLYANGKTLFISYMHPSKKYGFENGFDDISSIMKGLKVPLNN
jgi:hypothetical protein